MNAVVEDIDTNSSDVVARPTLRTRPFFWSVRRELWEHRGLWMAPLTAAALILLSFIANAMHVPAGGRMLASLQPEQLRAASAGFYGAISAVIAVTALTLTFFYCLDSLYSERRDRSILFWKSLPVSDLTTVTSKLFVATAVAPAITFVVVVATQLVILFLSMAIITLAGGSAAALWSSASILQLSVVLLYALVAQAIWFLPITAWLLFVSSWVRHAPVLGAFLVPAAIALVERIALGTTYVVSSLRYRGSLGFIQTAFSPTTEAGRVAIHDGGFNLRLELPDRIFDAMDPLRFLGSMQVWIGLAVAAALIAATVWMRRYREPF